MDERKDLTFLQNYAIILIVGWKSESDKNSIGFTFELTNPGLKGLGRKGTPLGKWMLSVSDLSM